MDRIAGVPLLLLAALVRRRRRLPVEPQRIGILSPTAIGDLILETGVVRQIRHTYPQASIHLFHGPTNAAVLPLLRVDVQAHRVDFTKVRETLAAIRAARLDVLIDLCPWPRLTALYAALSGAMTVGFRAEGQHRHYAFDVSVAHRRSVHEAENLHALARVFAPSDAYCVELRADLPASPLVLPYERLVLFHIGAGGSQAASKSWPSASWAELGRRLAKGGFAIGLTGTVADAPAISQVLTQAGLPTDQAFSLAGRLSLAELGGTVVRARLLVTVDTGVLHLASALDAPLIALHGPTHSARWGPRSRRAVSLNAPHDAAGYIHFGFETHPAAPEVMGSLSVDVVYEAAMAALSTDGAAVRVSEVPRP